MKLVHSFWLLIFLVVAGGGSETTAQDLTADEVDLQVRPRLEWREGYRRLLQPLEQGSLFSQQRTRIAWRHGEGKWEVKLGFQDVRVFGDPAGTGEQHGRVSASESWGAWKPNDKTRLTFGRQKIAFDNERIVGAVDWSQSGRFLDGIRWDQTSGLGKSTAALTWDAPNGITRLMFHHVYEASNQRLSLLYFDQHNSRDAAQTLMTYGFTWEAGTTQGVSSLLEGYGQSAVATAENAEEMVFMGVAELRYASAELGKVKLGVDWLQGSDGGDGSGLDFFKPFLGTNHRHYGWMDHFYVGGPANGLTNLHLQWKRDFHILERIATWDVRYHRFYQSDRRTLLANEWDAVLQVQPSKDVKWFVGWSWMKATEDMYAFQNRMEGAGPWQNWAWVQVNFSPKIKL